MQVRVQYSDTLGTHDRGQQHEPDQLLAPHDRSDDARTDSFPVDQAADQLIEFATVANRPHEKVLAVSLVLADPVPQQIDVGIPNHSELGMRRHRIYRLWLYRLGRCRLYVKRGWSKRRWYLWLYRYPPLLGLGLRRGLRGWAIELIELRVVLCTALTEQLRFVVVLLLNALGSHSWIGMGQERVTS